MPEATQRRLTAVVAADVVGYARLMGTDDAGTVLALRAHRAELIDPLIARHGGRIVKTMGDGLLLEFPSVVNAVNCALEVQTGMAARNETIAQDRRLQFRVGVNLGDIIIDGDDILGDGVNVAARLQEVAEPGGIAISGRVHEDVQDRFDAVFADAGAQSLKNIARPVRVWRWSPAMAAAPPSQAASLPLPDKPSIAVLPFDNMSGDPEQEFFADGMAEDIITALSRMPWFFVIARNSTFSYKGRAVDVKQIATELGVRYLLEGSVRKAGQRIRISAQLIDAGTGQHVWAERYDRQLADIFDIQDEVTEAIVGAVAPEFLASEVRRLRRKDPAQLDAWECVMRGRAHLWKLAREDAAEARRLFERAIELAPNGEFGTSDLALVCYLEAYYRWSDSPEASLRQMLPLAERAVAVDAQDPIALSVLAWAEVMMHRWDAALDHATRAVELSPNFASSIGMRGAIQALLGDADDAIRSIGTAIRLSPRDGFMALWYMGLFWAYHALEQYDEALRVVRQAIRMAPQNPTFRRQLAAALALQGHLDEARAALADYRALEPSHTLVDIGKVPSRDKAVLARFVEGLRLAGLPD